jgi:hypothetical protein
MEYCTKKKSHRPEAYPVSKNPSGPENPVKKAPKHH